MLLNLSLSPMPRRKKQPLVLVLDDLHWADQPSLLLLQFVAREVGNSRKGIIAMMIFLCLLREESRN